ncbi:hypothetical protein T11_806 [Trichinella zimbabwensis]|uniref:Uncharacterized protein n=1 Tax=Trichinella zimbabwensis TaxID=268475 RepID=A0A0V1HCW1_9BILA|nr:hypothetical protein T11_806 [Trichinella zimbabwensis]
MDENLPSVDCCKEGLGVQGTHIRYLSPLTTQNSSALLRFLQKSLLPCEAESQIRKLRALCKLSLLCTLRLGSPECKRQNCSPSSLVNCICIQAKSQINYDCPTLTVRCLNTADSKPKHKTRYTTVPIHRVNSVIIATFSQMKMQNLTVFTDNKVRP